MRGRRGAFTKSRRSTGAAPAVAMTNIGGDGDGGIGLWDEDDGFYYDALLDPDSTMHRLKIRSTVGLIPLFAVETIEPETLAKLPDFGRRMEWYLRNRPHLSG